MKPRVEIDANSLVERSAGIVDAEVDGEVVAMNADRGNCYGLNKVGSHIWHLVSTPQRVADICTALLSEYEVDPQACEVQVLDLLKQMQSEGLVTVVESVDQGP